jgi:hypothetical protein
MNDVELLQRLAGHFREMAGRDLSEKRRPRYLSLASQCDALRHDLEREQAIKPRLV